MKHPIIKTLRRNPILLFVGIPTLLVAIYTSILATDEIAASANAIVREENESSGPKMQGMPGMTAAAFNFGTSTSMEDAYLLESYLKSESFILQMNEELQLDKHFSSAGFFFFQRLSQGASVDTVYSYLLNRLSIQLSADSSIIGLRFRSFDSEYSQKVLNYIVKRAENKINDLSQRMSESRMSLAWKQLERAEKELRAANEAILAFQNENGWLNEWEVGAEFALIESLRSRLLDSQIERQTLLLSMSPDAPQIQNLEIGIQGIQASLTELQNLLLNDRNNSSILLANDYRRLSLELEFSQNKYAATTSAYEQAQKEASQQHKFLLLISPVTGESAPAAPKPLEATLTTFIVSLLIFLVLRLIILTIRDHTV